MTIPPSERHCEAAPTASTTTSEVTVAHYLIEVGYTPEAWSSQLDSQANVVDRIKPALDACGAKIESIYYAFGDCDLVGILDFKTPEDAAGFSLAVTSSGALRSFKTTPLLTVEQGMTSMKRGAQLRSKYTSPITVNLVEAQKTKSR
jgi:uncharacterized protein with GYD domain